MAKQNSSCEGDPDQKTLEVAPTIHYSLKTRQRTIEMLTQLATDADSIHQGFAASNWKANIIGAVGGGFIMAAGGMTIASSDRSGPSVLASLLTFCGAAFSVAGGTWSLKNEKDKVQRNKELQEEILEQLTKDEDARNEAKNIIRRIKRGHFGARGKIFRALHISLSAFGGVGMIYGSAVLPIDKLLALSGAVFGIPREASLVLKECLSLIPETAAFEGMEKISQHSAESAVKFMHNGLSKNFVQLDALIAAQKAYDHAYEKAIENAAAEAAKKGRSITAQTAKKAASKIAKQAARSAAKSAAEQSAKTAARVTGSVTLGFGVLTSVWEGYNAYQNHCETQKESQLGIELRDLVNRLENDLKENMSKLNKK